MRLKQYAIFVVISLLILVFIKKQTSLYTAQDKACRAYADYLSDNELYQDIAVGSFETSDTQLVFSLEYIDSDDIPELIVGWTKLLNNSSDILILTYKDGIVSKMGPIGHYNFMEFIPHNNIIMDNNSYYGRCTYWYGQIGENNDLITLCYASMPLNDEAELYQQDYEYYINEDLVSEEEYNKYLNSICKNNFVVWCGENNMYNLDILNEESLDKLRAGEIQIGKMEHNYLYRQ